MSRQPTKNKPQDGDRIRISFILDKRLEPELAYLFDLQGHGDRPRELVRLAVLGHRAEVEAKRIAQAARWGGLANLRDYLGPDDAGLPPLPEPSAVAAPRPPVPATKPNGLQAAQNLSGEEDVVQTQAEAPIAQEPAIEASDVAAAPVNQETKNEDAAAPGVSPRSEVSASEPKPPKEGPGPNLDFLS